MTKFEIQYGSDLRYLSKWECEANNPEHAKTLFRNKFGYNFIKIQYVFNLETGKKHY